MKPTILALVLIAVMASCSSEVANVDQHSPATDTAAVSSADTVAVYYFHFTRRCATCNAVETVARKSVEELYGDQVAFHEYNLDEDKGQAMGKKLEISGQALLIIANQTTVDITNEGFMYARSNPEKLKTLIKSKIDPLL